MTNIFIAVKYTLHISIAVSVRFMNISV